MSTMYAEESLDVVVGVACKLCSRSTTWRNPDYEGIAFDITDWYYEHDCPNREDEDE